jgi:hypothetical protein
MALGRSKMPGCKRGAELPRGEQQGMRCGWVVQRKWAKSGHQDGETRVGIGRKEKSRAAGRAGTQIQHPQPCVRCKFTIRSLA